MLVAYAACPARKYAAFTAPAEAPYTSSNTSVMPSSSSANNAAHEITPRIAPPSTISPTLRRSGASRPCFKARARSLSKAIVLVGFTPWTVTAIRHPPTAVLLHNLHDKEQLRLNAWSLSVILDFGTEFFV